MKQRTKIFLFTSVFQLVLVFAHCQSKCNQKLDSFSRRWVYFSGSEDAKMQGGPLAWQRKVAKGVLVDSNWINQEYDGRFEIGFIVEKNGAISSERTIHDRTGHVGSQLIKVVKEMNWKPGECQGRPVAMYHTMTIVLDVSDVVPDTQIYLFPSAFFAFSRT